MFITPGYPFKLVDALITNFHLPKSTLLMLVSAFAGYDRTRSAYAHAIEQQVTDFLAMGMRCFWSDSAKHLSHG